MKTAVATVEMRDCIGAEHELQDGRLNMAYKATMARLTPKRRSVLRTAERRWIGERDARCRRESSGERGGSLESVVFGICVIDETIRRTAWLKNYKG